MRFAIDVVFVDREERVVKVVPHLTPWKLAFGFGARSVIELAAGAAERLRIRVGEPLTVRQPS